jgi:DNA-binding Lrp family transcriptional regulator
VTREITKFRDYPEVEEKHMSTGECSVILKVRTKDTQSLEDFIGKTHLIEGLGTRSYVALSTYLERGPSPNH